MPWGRASSLGPSSRPSDYGYRYTPFGLSKLIQVEVTASDNLNHHHSLAAAGPARGWGPGLALVLQQLGFHALRRRT